MYLIFAFICPLLLYLSHPLNGFFVINFFALTPLIHSLQTANLRKMFLAGYLAGFVYFLLITDWIRILHLYQYDSSLLFLALSVVAALFQGMFWGMAGYLYGFFKKYGINNSIIFPAIFTITEWLRSLGVFGNTIGSFAYHQANNQLFVSLASFTGATALIFVIVLINQLLYQSVISFNEKKYLNTTKSLLSVMVIFGISSLVSLLNISQVDQLLRSSPSVRVAVFQPAIEQEKKINPRYYPQLKRSYLAHLEQFKQRVDYLILPETIVAEFLLDNKLFMWSLSSAIEDKIIFGTPENIGEDNYYNSMVCLDPQSGLLSTYRKIKIVPFGEYFPGRTFFAKILGEGFVKRYFVSQYQAGKTSKILDDLFAPAVCFESFSSSIIRKGINLGGKAILVITNDGWFKTTSMLREHQAADRLRAVENNRFLVQAANTGISFIVAPDGRIVQQIPPEKKGWLIGNLPLLEKPSPYSWYGDSAIYILIVLLLLLVYQKKINNHDN